MTLELFGTRWCPYTAEVRQELEFDGTPFIEHDIDLDDGARKRLIELTGSATHVPVLVEDGKITQVGWQGRSCFVGDR